MYNVNLYFYIIDLTPVKPSNTYNTILKHFTVTIIDQCGTYHIINMLISHVINMLISHVINMLISHVTNMLISHVTNMLISHVTNFQNNGLTKTIYISNAISKKHQ